MTVAPFPFVGQKLNCLNCVLQSTVLVLQALSSLGAFLFALFYLNYAI